MIRTGLTVEKSVKAFSLGQLKRNEDSRTRKKKNSWWSHAPSPGNKVDKKLT